MRKDHKPIILSELSVLDENQISELSTLINEEFENLIKVDKISSKIEVVFSFLTKKYPDFHIPLSLRFVQDEKRYYIDYLDNNIFIGNFET